MPPFLNRPWNSVVMKQMRPGAAGGVPGMAFMTGSGP